MVSKDIRHLFVTLCSSPTMKHLWGGCEIFYVLDVQDGTSGNPVRPADSISGQKRGSAISGGGGSGSSGGSGGGGGGSPDWRDRVQGVVREGWDEARDIWERTQASLGQFEGQLRRGGGQTSRGGQTVGGAQIGRGVSQHSRVSGRYTSREDQYERPLEEEDYNESFVEEDERRPASMDEDYSLEDEQSNSETAQKEVWTAERKDEIAGGWDEEETVSATAVVKGKTGTKSKLKTTGAPIARGATKGTEKGAGKGHNLKESWDTSGPHEEEHKSNDKENNDKEEEKRRTTSEAVKTTAEPSKKRTTSDVVVGGSHRLEDLTEYTRRRRGELNKVRVETSSVSTAPPTTARATTRVPSATPSGASVPASPAPAMSPSR